MYSMHYYYYYYWEIYKAFFMQLFIIVTWHCSAQQIQCTSFRPYDVIHSFHSTPNMQVAICICIYFGLDNCELCESLAMGVAMQEIQHGHKWNPIVKPLTKKKLLFYVPFSPLCRVRTGDCWPSDLRPPLQGNCPQYLSRQGFFCRAPGVEKPHRHQRGIEPITCSLRHKTVGEPTRPLEPLLSP